MKDKLEHVVITAFVTFFLGMLGFQCASHVAGWSFALIAGLAGVYGGVCKEFGDAQCPDNKFDWYDLLADVIGAVIGSAVLLLCFFAKG
jgi:VanZ family protein